MQQVDHSKSFFLRGKKLDINKQLLALFSAISNAVRCQKNNIFTVVFPEKIISNEHNNFPQIDFFKANVNACQHQAIQIQEIA